LKYIVYADGATIGLFYRKGKVQIGGNNKFESTVVQIVEHIFKLDVNTVDRLQIQSNKFRYVFDLNVSYYSKAIIELQNVYTLQLTDSLQRIMR